MILRWFGYVLGLVADIVMFVAVLLMRMTNWCIPGTYVIDVTPSDGENP